MSLGLSFVKFVIHELIDVGFGVQRLSVFKSYVTV